MVLGLDRDTNVLASTATRRHGSVGDAQTCMPTLLCDSIEREQAHKQACPQYLVVALAHHGYVNNHTHATRGQRLDMKGMPKVYPCHHMVPLRHIGHVNGGVLNSTGVPGTGSACKQV